MTPDLTDPQAQIQAQIQHKLQQVWGYETLRSPQGEIVQCLLAGRDAIVIMPTGGGKSICFQLPAVMQTGLTIVISPLVALMENQVQDLHRKNISAAVLHSELSRHEYRKTIWQINQNKLRLLYVSPETLLTSKVWDVLINPAVNINHLILDEAHCLTQWGDTFRPAYFRLGMVRSALLQTRPGARITIAAFTATADPTTQQTIQRILNLQDPVIFRLNPYRSNLTLNVQTVWTPATRRRALLQFLKSQGQTDGLVYARSRRDTETIAQWLTTRGYRAIAYHAGLGSDQRRQIERDWIAGQVPIVVSTSAFGMGIDKPNCRWVVHFQVPLLLSEYVQEVGRAGRDGKPAIALSLISEPTGWFESGDRTRRRFFQSQWRKQQREVNQLAKKLPPQGKILDVARQFPNGALTLSWLYGIGRVEWLDPFHYRQMAETDRRGETNQLAVRQFRRYLRSSGCRWQFLLAAFGFETEAKGLRCGHCDRCRSTRRR